MATLESCTHVIYPNHIVKLLLATSKVDVDSKDSSGLTALWWAAREGHEAVVKLLQPTIPVL
jgi:ankyrin repeat protein